MTWLENDVFDGNVYNTDFENFWSGPSFQCGHILSTFLNNS